MIEVAISNILNINVEAIKDLKRFERGMSNYTYYFKVGSNEYTYRKIGMDAELFVNYEKEFKHLKLASNAGITSEIVYFNVETGEKIQKYLKGQTLDFKDIDIFGANLIKTLKKLHSLKSSDISDYQLLKRLDTYESYLNEKALDDNYFKLKNYFIKTYNEHFINNPKVFCHNDIQNINAIFTKTSVHLIDFEFAGLNDIYYDFATFEENADLIYEMYYNKSISSLDSSKIAFYKLYQQLQWYLVATHKDNIGFSKLTNYDFKALANYFINKALSIYKEISEVNFNDN